MFSSLPKLADKAFIVAFLVPTLAFLLALGAAFPGLFALAEQVNQGDNTNTLVNATLAAAGVWFCALGLMLINRPLYRSLEGYFGPLAATARVKALQAVWDACQQTLAGQLAKAKRLSGSERAAAARAYNSARLSMARRFPPKRERVLGSRFGNVNRAFEDYPEGAYGVFAVATWPRLSAVIPASFQSRLTDARAQVNCFVNLTFLALAFATVEIGRWLWNGAAAVAQDWVHTEVDFILSLREAVAHADWTAFLAAMAALVAARVAYELALDRAKALGEQVRAAFDLYLGGLAKQLGYDLPQAEADRRELWKRLRRTWSYGDPTPETFRSKRPPDPPPGADEDADEHAADQEDDGNDKGE